MIVSFSVKNWMSFRDISTFSMIASQERQHGNRLPKINKYNLRLLPIGVIYGGNASGKTNLFKALSFARDLITKGTMPDRSINVEGFLLDDEEIVMPTSFSFTLLIDESIYEYSFSLTLKEIIEEKLVKITSTSEKTLYHRLKGKPNFHISLVKDEFLKFAFRGTRDNQLFLTNSVSQNVNTFLPVHDWFKNALVLISPDSRFEPFEWFIDEKNPLYKKMNDTLSQLDTGIEHLGGENIPFDNLPFSESIKSEMREELKENMAVRLRAEPGNGQYIVTKNNDRLIVKKLIAAHKDTSGKDRNFNINQESDGTRRIIDLLPAFIEMSEPSSKKVYVIDEVDRSLHTLLTRQLIERYLSCCLPESRSQLLLTTHDTLLMDQKLLRRDEMWVTERNSSGESTLFSFSEYKNVRYDKDIRKSYLQGRLGGIPRIFLNEILTTTCDSER